MTIPLGAVAYVDANALIYAVERLDPYATLLQPLWNAAKLGNARLISSQLLIVEALTGPLKAGNLPLADAYEQIFRSNDPHLLAVTPTVLRRAAHIRATHGLKTPDAIHAATALDAGCSMFVTNDAGFRRVAGLAAVILSEVLKS
jgi:predicted nucleic acid-binding protein